MQKSKRLPVHTNKFKHTAKSNKKFIEKLSNKAWICGICNHQNDPLYPYCLQCYLDLHYYTYVNMHLFVTHDDSYKKTYYQIQKAQNDFDHCSCETNDTESEQGDEGEQLAIDFVEYLLIDE